ncbi:hypothetical protein B7463_g11288, partial [Scytalidium lignicola]
MQDGTLNVATHPWFLVDPDLKNHAFGPRPPRSLFFRPRLIQFRQAGYPDTSQTMETSGQAQVKLYPRLNFITVLDPGDLKQPNQRKAVRSHAACYQNLDNSQVFKHHIRAQPARKRRRKATRYSEFIILSQPQPNIEFLSNKTSRQTTDLSPGPAMMILGQGRVDPFRTYPVPYEPFIPRLVDHYLVNMAIDMPELDEPDKPGLLRTRWFPLVLTEAATFQVIMLIAASHFVSLLGSFEHGLGLLKLKSNAICLLGDALAAEGPTDQLIGAVAKMASYEAMFGELDTYEMHMEGLVKMIELRGGLHSLGLSGMLAKICVWIDRNSSILHNTRLHFISVPDELLAHANLTRFLADI